MSNGLPASERALPAIRLQRSRLIWLGVLAVLTVALLLALGDAGAAWQAVKRADPRLIGLALVVHYSGFAVRGYRWQRLLAVSGHRLSYRYAASVLLGGWFVSALLPARLGDAFRVAVLRLPSSAQRPSVPVADSLGVILLERALDISAILVLSAGFGYAALGARLPRWLLMTYLVTLGILALFALALLLVPALIDRLKRWSGHRLWHAGLDFARQLIAGLHTLPRRPGTGPLVVVASLYIWLCDAAVLWLVIAGLGARLPFAEAGFVALTVDIFAAVPLTPGGMGQVEAVYAALLALLAAAPFSVAAAVLVTRAITYWSFLLFSGAVTFAAGFGSLLAPQPSTEPASDLAQRGGGS
jgi:hypothetical protein